MSVVIDNSTLQHQLLIYRKGKNKFSVAKHLLLELCTSRGIISMQNYNNTSLSVLYVDDENNISVGQLPSNSLIQLLSYDDADKLVAVVWNSRLCQLVCACACRIVSLTDDLVEVENLSAFPADMLAVTGFRRLVSVVSSYG